jgi:membrane-bound metal-dependent hydrolase YbcI (DUF457 family)
MDIVHHALIGVAGFQNAANEELFPHGTAFLFGSVFPDLDVAFMALGKRFYLKNHQALTHSLPLSPLYALLLASPLFLLEGFSWSLLLAALCGLWLHIALDWSNTFRLAPFAPFSYRRYSLDAIFFIDSVALTFTAGFYLLYSMVTAELWVTALYGGAFLLYVLLKLWLQRWVKVKQRATIAIPSSLNPFAFYLLSEDVDGYYSRHFNTLTGRTSQPLHVARVEPEIMAQATKSPVFADMQHVCRALHIVEVERSDEGITLHAADIAVRNFGGRFGRTVLKFDPQGELVSEVANI